MPAKIKAIDRENRILDRKPSADPALDEIKRRYILGESEFALAAAFNTSRSTIRRRLIYAGVHVRGLDESQKLRYRGTSKAYRQAITKAAHDAVRGSKRSIADLENRAKGVERVGRITSPYEQLFQEYLHQVGIYLTPQKAVGIYNPDFASDSVIVEIFGGNFHRTRLHALRDPVKFKYFLKREFNVIVIWTDNREKRLTVDGAKYVASIIKLTDSDESFRGEYRVIRGDGKLSPELGPHL